MGSASINRAMAKLMPRLPTPDEMGAPDLSSPKPEADEARAAAELLEVFAPLKDEKRERLTPHALHRVTGGCGMTYPTFQKVLERPLSRADRLGSVLAGALDAADRLPAKEARRVRSDCHGWLRRYFDGAFTASMRPVMDEARRRCDEMERAALLEAYEAMDERGRRAVFGMMAEYMKDAGRGGLADRLKKITDVM